MSGRQTVGWVGVGAMGGPMAARLIRAGWPVTVCGSGRRDLRPYAAETGASLAEHPEALAQKAEIVFTMIPNGAVLLEILDGGHGLLKGGFAGKTLVDMSTVDPDSSARAAALVEAAGGHFLRAPVTGSTHYAKEGTLGIMASGPRETYEACLPLLQVLGSRQTYLGPGEEARCMKIVINLMLGQELQAYSEALVLGQRLGLPWETMIDLICDSAAAAPIFRYKADTMKRRDFTPTSSGYNMYKDMKLAMDLAQREDANLPTAALTMQMYNSLMTMGLDRRDNTGILLVNEALNGIHLGESKNEGATT